MEAKNQTFQKIDGNIHVVPDDGKHIESKDCWCEPRLSAAIDEEHNKEVWVHKGYEELNQ